MNKVLRHRVKRFRRLSKALLCHLRVAGFDNRYPVARARLEAALGSISELAYNNDADEEVLSSVVSCRLSYMGLVDQIEAMTTSILS